MRYVIAITLLVIGVCAWAQQRVALLDSLQYRVEMQATLSGGDHNPLWLNANKYGLSSLDKSNGYLRAAIERPLALDQERQWGFGYCLDLALTYNFTSTVVAQQVFVEGRWKRGVLTIGSKEQPLELKNQELSSGSQTFGINARPVPQVRLSLPDYWTVPYTRGWLALKGHIAYGWLTDDTWQKDYTKQQSKYNEGTLFHSKALYLRIGNEERLRHVSLELGLEMASTYGGTSYPEGAGGTVVDNEGGLKGAWNAFFGGGSEATETLYKNVSGDMLGSWVFRLNLDYDAWRLGLYGDHYFEDHSAMFFLDYDGYGTGSEWDTKKKSRYLLYDLKDIQLGVDLRLKRVPWLNSIVVEYLHTKYQSGPVYHDHTVNISDHIGGRDNYYNHHLLNGWQHWGQAIGNPLYTAPLYNADRLIYFENNRFTAWHLGVAGDPTEGLHYRLLATFQHSFGTYHRPFSDPQHSQQLLAEATYRFPERSRFAGWSVKGAIGADFGKTYGDNVGFLLTVIKRGGLRVKK